MKLETVAEMIRRLPLVGHQVTDVWKAMITAEILLPEYLIRHESCGEYSATATAN